MTALKINNWTLSYHGTEFTAPEARSPYLHGLVEGREHLGNARTSPILRVENGIAYTQSGSQYLLGTPSDCWNKHCPSTDFQNMDHRALVMDTVPGDVLQEHRRAAKGNW